MKKILDKKILITGGGSGGHVSVSHGYIEQLKNEYSNVDDMILYVGSDLSMVGEKRTDSLESRVMKDLGIPFVSIRAGKLQRSFELETIKLLFRSILGIYDAIKLVKRYKPNIIFCSGGYLGVPVSIAAWIFKIPIFLHEQTAAVGLSNNFVGKFAKKIFITFPSSEKYFPKGKTIHTGNIVREVIFNTKSDTPLAKAVELMKKENKKIIYVTGGSQGSHKINTVISQILKYALEEYQLIIQTGDNQVTKDYDILYKEWHKLPSMLQKRLYVTKYVNSDEIGYIFKNSDLVIGRAGANTVYELGVLKKLSILIPIPWVTHNEQFLNAKILEDAGICTILPEGELTCEKLHSTILKVLNTKPNSIDIKKLEDIFILNAKEKIVEETLR